MKKLWMLGVGAMLLPLAGCNRRMEWSPVDMWNRSRYKPLEPEPFFANGSSTQAPVPGTVARGQLHTDELMYQGRVRGSGVAPLTVQGDGTTLSSRGSTGGSNSSVGSANGMTSNGMTTNSQGGSNVASSGLTSGDNGLGNAATLATTLPFPVTFSVLKRGEERYNTYCAPCHSRAGDGQGMIVERGFSKPPSFHIQRLRKAPVGHYFDVITHGYGAMYPYASRVETRDRWAIIAYIRLLQARSAKYGTDMPQTEGGPGLPIYKGGRPDELPRDLTTEKTKNSEHNENASLQPTNNVNDSSVKSTVHPNGLEGSTKTGSSVESGTNSQARSTQPSAAAKGGAR